MEKQDYAIEAPSYNILDVNSDMRRFVAEHIASKSSPQGKLRQLIKAVMSQGTLNLSYEENNTFTASDTFTQRGGNCLSFANMFIALAREAGIRAYYQEVESPPTWGKQADYIILSKHMNVLIKIGKLEERVIDFNQPDYRAKYDQKKVTDNYAFAQFYSNIGVNFLHSGQHGLAFAHFRKAIQLDPSMPHSWTNLGALYSRKGIYSHAEAAYLKTLSYSPSDRAALTNLNKLYRFLGQSDHARYYEERVNFFRDNNPYYYQHVSKQALGQDDYKSALKAINKAIRIKKDDSTFYHSKAVILERSDDKQGAAHNLKLAMRNAPIELKENYLRKLELLESTQ